MIKKFFSVVFVFVLGAGISAPQAKAQIFRPAEITPNVVDFDLVEIVTCVPNDPIPFVICEELLPEIVDQLIQAEELLDQIFVGYRRDMPRFVRNQLQGDPVVIRVRFAESDGPGNTLATAGPDQQFIFQPPRFLLNFRRYRSWIVPRFSTINLDVEDIIPLMLTDEFIDVVVHEAMHALGHPASFLGPDPFGSPHLNRPLNFFNQINFLGDEVGVNDIGFGLTEFRAESANPFATFIPLSTTDGGGHLNPFEPAFNQPANSLQEVFLPTAPFGDIRTFLSRSLRGMFADLAFEITGVTNDNILDFDGDGIDDAPLIINPD